MTAKRSGAGVKTSQTSNDRKLVGRSCRECGRGKRVQEQFKSLNVALFSAFRQVIQGRRKRRGGKLRAVLRKEALHTTGVRNLDVSEIRNGDFVALANVARCDEFGHWKSKGRAGPREFGAVRIAAVIHEAACYVKTRRKAVEAQAAKQQEKVLVIGRATPMRRCTAR